ncbi:MAG: hypothetical protein K0B01_04850 [Syntrophobacterales bacterium]|nr:hypothetical protein [Syntrophobacterales bacterium]
MTTKNDVDLTTYRKGPRLLTQAMEDALGPGGMLNPVLVRVAADQRLRLEIRDHRFNIYYRGGNLMRVDGRKKLWSLHFDKEYFNDISCPAPELPQECIDANLERWIEAFPDLIAGMDRWFDQHRNDESEHRHERDHCQKIATENAGIFGRSSVDYLVLDLEYEYAKCRFDMIAAKRRITLNDATGWEEPYLVFVEVKSEYGACTGVAGLEEHAKDFRRITTAGDGQPVIKIKKEYEDLREQTISHPSTGHTGSSMENSWPAIIPATGKRT